MMSNWIGCVDKIVVFFMKSIVDNPSFFQDNFPFLASSHFQILNVTQQRHQEHRELVIQALNALQDQGLQKETVLQDLGFVVSR